MRNTRGRFSCVPEHMVLPHHQQLNTREPSPCVSVLSLRGAIYAEHGGTVLLCSGTHGSSAPPTIKHKRTVPLCWRFVFEGIALNGTHGDGSLVFRNTWFFRTTNN